MKIIIFRMMVNKVDVVVVRGITGMIKIMVDIKVVLLVGVIVY